MQREQNFKVFQFSFFSFSYLFVTVTLLTFFWAWFQVQGFLKKQHWHRRFLPWSVEGNFDPTLSVKFLSIFLFQA